MTFSSLLSIRSHPVRVRGLKHRCSEYARYPMESHPVRVRGLKLYGAVTIDGKT